MGEPTRPFVERRRGPDAVVKAVWWLSGISWALVITALAFIDQAKPENETFFDRLFNIRVRNYWDNELLQYALLVLFINLATCAAGLALNLMRHRRKTDRINKSIVILAAVSLAGIIWFLG